MLPTKFAKPPARELYFHTWVCVWAFGNNPCMYDRKSVEIVLMVTPGTNVKGLSNKLLT